MTRADRDRSEQPNVTTPDDEQTEVERLRQGLWDTWAALGHDTDGDTGPGALIAGMSVDGFIDMVVRDAERYRAESEEDYDADITRLERALADERAKVAAVKVAAGPRSRTVAWLSHLGYTAEQIVEAEAWRPPAEYEADDPRPDIVRDLDNAAEFSVLYAETIDAALAGPEPDTTTDGAP